MALTDREVLDAVAARDFGIRRTERGWIVMTAKGRRVQVPPAVTPEVAVEAAQTHLLAREAELKNRRAQRLVDEMQKGRYFHQVRRVEEDDGSGGTTLVTVFDIAEADGQGGGTTTGITGRASVVQAWRDLIVALEAGETP